MRTIYLTDDKEIFEISEISNQKELDKLSIATSTATDSKLRWTFDKPKGATLSPLIAEREAFYTRFYS